MSSHYHYQQKQLSPCTTLDVDLRRPDTSVPWGFRLEGGSDVGLPLRIARVVQGSLAESAGLFEDDIVLTLNGTDATNMTHSAAKMEIIRSANDINFVIGRSRIPGYFPQVIHCSRPSAPRVVSSTKIMPVKQSNVYAAAPPRSPVSPKSFNTAPHKVYAAAPPPRSPKSFNTAPQPFSHPAPLITKDNFGRTKQIAHKQYNSPMGLYSSSNVKNTLDNTVKVAHTPQPPHQQTSPNFGKTLFCHLCGDMIKGVFIRVNGEHPVHQTCLKCCICGIGLQNVGYFFVNNSLYCETHARQASRPKDTANMYTKVMYN